MSFAILDSNIYVGRWERGLYQKLIGDVTSAHILRHSSVVLSELRRGARGSKAQRWIAAVFKQAHDPWAPSSSDWWEAGRLALHIGDAKGWDVHKRRGFQNDALIALTARRRAATVVTANRTDFELLSRAIGVHVLFA